MNSTEKKIILGFVGPMASGKGAASDYLIEKYDVGHVRYSTMLRDMADRLFLPHTRDVLITMSEAIREKFGDDIMAKVVREEAMRSPKRIVCIDGIRRPMDIEVLKDAPGFTLVHITADMRTRYERLIARTENSDDQTKTFEQFEQEHQRSTEVTIAQVAAGADVTIDNNGTFEQLYAQLDKLITTL